MKIKTLVKLNELKKKPAKIFIYTCSKQKFELNTEKYMFCADNKILDWSYVNTDKGDEIIIYL